MAKIRNKRCAMENKMKKIDESDAENSGASEASGSFYSVSSEPEPENVETDNKKTGTKRKLTRRSIVESDEEESANRNTPKKIRESGGKIATLNQSVASNHRKEKRNQTGTNKLSVDNGNNSSEVETETRSPSRRRASVLKKGVKSVREVKKDSGQKKDSSKNPKQKNEETSSKKPGNDEEDNEVDQIVESVPSNHRKEKKHQTGTNKMTVDKGDSSSEEETETRSPSRKRASVREVIKESGQKKNSFKNPKQKNEDTLSKKSGNDEEEYEVEQIVDRKKEFGVTYFLVHWKGYTSDEDTWEREDSLSCPELIEKFEKNAVKTVNQKKTIKKVASGKNIAPSDSSKQWEVQKIVDFADDNNVRMFRIRWKGYKSKDDTWEPEANLSCDDAIQKFLSQVKSEEFLSFKELRIDPKKTKPYQLTGRKSKRSRGKEGPVYYGDDV